jgi:hypothetical protein
LARIRREGADGRMPFDLRLTESPLHIQPVRQRRPRSSVAPALSARTSSGRGQGSHSGGTTPAVAASLARHSQTGRNDANTQAIVRVATVGELSFAPGSRSNICEVDCGLPAAHLCARRLCAGPAPPTASTPPRQRFDGVDDRTVQDRADRAVLNWAELERSP